MIDLSTNKKSERKVLSMYNSILQYMTKGLEKLEKETEELYEKPETFARYANRLKESMLELGSRILADNLENMDEAIRHGLERKKNWDIVRKDRTTLLTSLGSVTYHKTLFKNKRTKKRAYLLDQLMELEPHERFTADAMAELYEKSVEGSYEKGAEAVPGQKLSKQTVKNKLHAIEFPPVEPPTKRKRVKNLYVEADEDHVSLQFQEKKGDLKGEGGQRLSNGCLAKLVYVHEGATPEKEGSARRRLEGTKYFGGVREGSEENRKLWKEVDEHIRSHCELEEGGRVFIKGDGAAWIQTGEEILGKEAVSLLDEFHLQKYVNRATNHMKDSKEDAREQLREAVKEANETEAKRLFDVLERHAKTEGEKTRVRESEGYILGNWKRIEAAKLHEGETMGCSAEGHVSHLLSARLSSRPLGWSKTGADKMSRLRLYKANGGDLLELAEYQGSKAKATKAREPKPCTAAEAWKWEKKAKNELEKNYDKLQKTLGNGQIRKTAKIRLRLASL